MWCQQTDNIGAKTPFPRRVWWTSPDRSEQQKTEAMCPSLEATRHIPACPLGSPCGDHRLVAVVVAADSAGPLIGGLVELAASGWGPSTAPHRSHTERLGSLATSPSRCPLFPRPPRTHLRGGNPNFLQR